MTVLYRYLSNERAEKLVTAGEDWIGTLHGFRDIEKHGNQRGDEDEGIKSGTLSEDGIYTPQTLPPMLSRFIKGVGKIKMKMAGIKRIDTARDCYIYCMSKSKNDERLLKEFGETCVSISDYDSFLEVITEEISKRIAVEFKGLFDCIYRPRHTDHSDWTDIDPSIIKSPEYDYQEEVRALWFPVDKNVILKSIHISSKKLTQHCSL